MNARIIIGSNYGDEGKGTVVATYTKQLSNVLNILTNGGAQRGHSILTKDGNITFQHFGSGTYHGADSYYSRFFILNPMQFVREYNSLIIKPNRIYRDKICRWSTPYDTMANYIKEQSLNRKASCGMGIWNTIKRCNNMPIMLFDDFLLLEHPESYLLKVKNYYEKDLDISSQFRDIWDSPYMMTHFIEDCKFMAEHTAVCELKSLTYDNMIFENGQGLLLCDTGKDTYDTTPSNTGILYSLELLKDLEIDNVIAHYVTRPYLTRHGDGHLMEQSKREILSNDVKEDRTNHFNDFQGEFRYGQLNINSLHDRIESDCQGIKYEIELTHCDEMDRLKEFQTVFGKINTYDSPLIK